VVLTFADSLQVECGGQGDIPIRSAAAGFTFKLLKTLFDSRLHGMVETRENVRDRLLKDLLIPKRRQQTGKSPGPFMA
jgi:hypothetical protein